MIDDGAIPVFKLGGMTFPLDQALSPELRRQWDQQQSRLETGNPLEKLNAREALAKISQDAGAQLFPLIAIKSAQSGARRSLLDLGRNTR